jgi:hypothetical protein
MHKVRRVGRLRTVGMISVAGLLGVLACTNTNVPDLNLGSVSGFQTNPTASGAEALFYAMLAGERDETALFIQTVGSFGREGYNLSVSNGSLPFYVVGPLTTGSFLVQTQLWQDEYADIREAELISDNLPKITTYTAAQAAAMEGLVQTMEAYDVYLLAVTRDSLGLPIVVDVNPTAPPAPIAPRAQVFQHLYNLIDSGATNLAAGGSAFPFQLPAGLSGFDTPATFLTLNRALRVRVDIVLSNYTQALTDLGASFVSSAAPLTTGVYFNYTTTSGDEQNGIFTQGPVWYASPRLADSAQLQPGGAPDLRAQQKLVNVGTFTFDGITSPYQFTIYNTASSPIAMIRNEELILLRAEANFNLGNSNAALTDINLIRQSSGGLAPVTLAQFPTQNALLQELLYEKRYSLMWEGGHEWIDRKHYGELGMLPAAVSGGRLFNLIPFPLSDCQAYSPQPAGCTTIIGIPGVPGESP